ncbi:MAG: outer membrane beta-barrel protein, partial [Ferruginibacter sp.]
TSLSNKFDNTITTNNGGLTYRYSKTKDDMLAFGISYQHTKLESQRIFPSSTKVDQTFSNFLPNAMWRKKLSLKSNVRIYYRSSTNFPSVNQLQDVINLTNPLRVSVGNPSLKQAFTNYLSARYTFTNSKTSQSFFANIFLQTTADYISNGIWVAENDSTIQQGNLLNKGSQLTKPVNLNGYRNVRTFFTYSFPLKKIKTTVNLNAGFGYTKLPGLSNYIPTITDNLTYNGGVVFASNISQYVDFNIAYNASVNNAHTRGQTISDNNYVNQSIGGTLNLLNKKGWFIQNDVFSQIYQGLSGSLSQTFTLWNAAIGKKFLKSQAAEIKLSAFDLLKQNQSITRTVTESYIQDNQSQVLQRYFMLTFTYNLKNFGTAKKGSGGNNQDHGGGMQHGGR